MKYVLISVIVVILAYVGYLASNNPSLFQVKVEKSVSVSADGEWNVYNNSKYAFQISYPPSFVLVEEGNFAGHDEIHFGSNSIKNTVILINVYDAALDNIKNIADIPYSNKKNVTSSEVINNGTSIQIVQRIKNPNESSEPIGADILFIHSNNAYDVEWICLAREVCFDDQALKKMAMSVTFSK